MKLSPQQEIIVKALRSKEWVCGSVWLTGIKDDRARISALNKGYMKEHGWRIVGKPCDGRCGTKHTSNLYMRRAEPIHAPQAILERSETPFDLPATLKAMDVFWQSLPDKKTVWKLSWW